jgi:Flp pilus assembly protein TadG
MRSFKVKHKAFSLFFTLVLIPFLLIGLCFSADCARVIMASHTASLLADNLSMAAATGIASDNKNLDTSSDGLVYQRVNEMMNISKNTGMVTSDISKTLQMKVTNLSLQSVTINITYSIDDLILFNYLLGGKKVFSGSVSRTSGPCLSNPGQSCAYLA